MDTFTPGALPGEAKLKFDNQDFEILKPGRFVVCAVTKRKIPLEDLRYWSIEQQEAYADAEAALTRWKQLNGG